MKPFPKPKTKIFILVITFSSFFIRLACAENSGETFSAEFSLASLNGKNGFVIKGINGSGQTGSSVSSAGDVNGDGIADILIGARMVNKGAGQTYIIFGSDKGWPSAINIESINSHNGLIVNGISHGSPPLTWPDFSGYSVSKAGDLNGDYIDDILISAPHVNHSALHANQNLFAGQIYVLFGNKQGWPSPINLTDLDGNNGFTINGSVNGAQECGIVLHGGDDFNGDGIADILLGTNDIATYVIFGGRNKWPASIDLLKVNGTDGFAIRGKDGVVRIFGNSVTSIGDINADSIADILITVNINSTDRDFVLFGSKREWPAVFNITDFNGINGFFIDGIKLSIRRKNAVGDINGDGIDDIWLGDQNDPVARVSYIVFGSEEQWPAAINITNLDGNNGFAINGFKKGLLSQGGTGDVNGDGIDDILMRAYSPMDLGRCYVVFGSRQKWPAAIDVTNLNGDNGFVIMSINKEDFLGDSLRITKDINGDGIDDILISAPINNNEVGQVYVVFGRRKKTFDWLPAIISTAALLGMGTYTGYTGYHYYFARPSPPVPTSTTNSPVDNYHTID